jgi:peptide deformylase
VNILKLGDSQLYQVAAVVRDHGSSSFLEDVELLKLTLEEEGGMGIAAPQLGIDRQLFLIHSKPNKRYPFAPKSEFLVMSNPKILEKSDEKELGWEGCSRSTGRGVAFFYN